MTRRVRLESLGTSWPRRGPWKGGSLRHAVDAGRRCLAASKYNPADVRVIVNAGVHRDEHVCEPAIAAYVQHGLGVNVEFQGRRTLAFDLLNGGCGMLSAVHVVSSLVLAGEADVGMVVASEANSDRRPDPGWTYPSSGAAALLDVSPRRAAGFGAFAFLTREEHADLYTSVVSLALPRGRLLLRRKAGLEDAWLAMARPVFDEALAREGIGRDEVGLVVPAQISASFVRRLPEVLELPPEKIFDIAQRLPDTLTTSTFLALDAARREGRTSAGTNTVLMAFGSGITAGAAVYRE